MTNCGGTRVNTAEWERFMSPPKLFGYQTLSCITSKKYHIIHGSSVSVSEMSIRCLYSITIWPLAIVFFPRRNARDDDNWCRLINSYRNWEDGSDIATCITIFPRHYLQSLRKNKQCNGNGLKKKNEFSKTLKALLLLLQVLNSWNFERVVFRSHFSS